MNRDGEGAAIQLIWYPTGDKYVKKYKNALNKIQNGVPLKEAIDIPDSISGEIVHTFKDLFSRLTWIHLSSWLKYFWKWRKVSP